jgi:cell division protein FtsA
MAPKGRMVLVGELVVAIDIGTSKVCALCGRIDKSGQAEILAKAIAPCTGMKKGQITDIESVARSITDALKQIETAAALRIGSAYINLLGLHVDVFTNRTSVVAAHQGREIARGDVQRLLDQVRRVEMPPDTQVIDVIPKQFIIDGYGGILEPIGMTGVNIDLEADIVTGKVAAITNIIK